MLENHPVLSFIVGAIVSAPFAVTVAVLLLGGAITVTLP